MTTSPMAERLLANTSKRGRRPAALMLEDGTLFHGWSCGARGTAVGEACFNTSMEGYLEVISDPSYAGQVVALTYPQIGNYGVCREDAQSETPALSALVVNDLCRTPSSWRSEMGLADYLEGKGVVAVEGVDTRALVRRIRSEGAQKAIVSTEVGDPQALAALLAEAPALVGRNLVQGVSGKAAAPPCTAPRYRVVVYDCGAKRSILDRLVHVGCRLSVVPWDTPAEDVLATAPDGVFLSNGPGDPAAVPETYRQVEKLVGRVPVFGICLGHQMMSLAAGGRMDKLPFGHHGGNHPVMNLVARHVEITAQNHGFGLAFDSLGPILPELSGGQAAHPEDGDLRHWVRAGVAPVVDNARFGRIRLTHVNLNDGTCEGIEFLDVPAFGVQYHPEASPGPVDAGYLFAAFARLMDGKEGD